jgi:hypothetical protein
MKTILKLLIAALIVNAAVRAGAAWWSFYQFEDETQETIRFAAGTETADTLVLRILARAQERELPIKADGVDVQREGPRIVASAHYVQPVEFIPRYKYPIKMAFQVEAYTIAGAVPPPRRN